MSSLSKEYNKILSQIDNIISNEGESKQVREKVIELSTLFLETIEKLSSTIDNKLVQIEKKQRDIDDKIENLKESVNEIESDIYDEEEMGEFDFEIVCPYCNYEFITDLDVMNEDKNEIKCPECNNIIELDWNDEDEGCGGHCLGCHGCDGQIDEDEDM